MRQLAAKKRKRPTKLYVKDTDAIQSLLAFGINHRASVADQCVKRFQQITTPGDRLSLAIECFVCMMASIEDLEKAYYALRRKTAGTKGSFFRLFTTTSVSEPAPSAKYAADERSARLARKQISAMSRKRFQESLGLPTFEEWESLDRAPAGSTRAQRRQHYNREIDWLRKHMLQAFKNRANKRLMNVYNKAKHGFVALHGGNPPTAFLVERAYGKGQRACWVQCLPFEGTELAAKTFFSNTKEVALALRMLLTLYGRIEMQPPPKAPAP